MHRKYSDLLLLSFLFPWLLLVGIDVFFAAHLGHIGVMGSILLLTPAPPQALTCFGFGTWREEYRDRPVAVLKQKYHSIPFRSIWLKSSQSQTAQWKTSHSAGLDNELHDNTISHEYCVSVSLGLMYTSISQQSY